MGYTSAAKLTVPAGCSADASAIVAVPPPEQADVASAQIAVTVVTTVRSMREIIRPAARRCNDSRHDARFRAPHTRVASRSRWQRADVWAAGQNSTSRRGNRDDRPAGPRPNQRPNRRPNIRDGARAKVVAVGGP